VPNHQAVFFSAPIQKEETMSAITSFVKRHQVVSFYILTYALTWLAMFPATLLYLQGKISTTQDALLFVLLGSYAPMVSAILLTAVIEGRAGVVTLLKKLVKWRVNIVWYLVAIYGPLVVAGIAYFGLGGANASANLSKFPQAFLLVPVNMAVNIWFGPLGEELGWRGYALPRLLTRHTALTASVIIGVLWSFWHLPLYVFPDFWFGA
jgi:membrane protease YdiL (CAAX protease family)